MKKQIILASRSPWRKRLLARHGIPCRIHVSNFKELKRHKNPRFLVKYNAEGKAGEVARHYEAGIILGVDTVGVIGKTILGKPQDRAGAKRMLLRLRGKPHRVLSGLCVLDAQTAKKKTVVVATKILFRPFTEEELEKYLDCGQWKGKAGSYAIQGRAKGFVKDIVGDVTNVVGLPIEVLKKLLRMV